MIYPDKATFTHICLVNNAGKASYEILKYFLLVLAGLSFPENIFSFF